MQLVQRIEEIQPDDTELYGGKAVNLAKLIHLGFKTPRGFSISSEAFSQVVRENKTLSTYLAKIDKIDDFEEILDISEKIQNLITDFEIPERLVSGISDSLKEIEETEFGYAVRSSATIEDRSDISFAGQAESYLCVKDLAGIIQAVKKVWLSTFSDRALIYLKAKGIPLDQVKMAVLIQEMIPAKISGVMFTANVVTNDTGEVLINSTWGLGNTLVSGEIVPDTFILTKDPLQVIQRNLGNKELTSKSENYSLLLTDTPEEKRTVYSLDEKTLFDIVLVGLKIESGMESPQDIEWCIQNDGSLTILQTRPITTLNVLSSDEE